MSTDSEIIQRSLADPSAFTVIFDRHAPVVGRYASRRLGPQDAEDVVSETFLVAFRRRRTFDLTYDSALPWLLGIATRLAKRHRAVEARHWETIQSGAASAVPLSDVSTERAAERADAARAVSELWPEVEKLASRDRDTLMLYALAELSYDEVATALGVPIGTVRSRLNRVRKRLAAHRHLAPGGVSDMDMKGHIDGHSRARA